MNKCPNCNSSDIVRHYKKREGMLLLLAALIAFLIDLFTDSLSVFLYAIIAVLCIYYFFSKGRYFYTCSNCMSEFHNQK